MKFRGRKKPRAQWRVTIKPDGAVDLFGYSQAELLMLSQQDAFGKLMQGARENPPTKAEVRDLDLR